MNLTFQTDDNTRYTLTKSENFGYTLAVSRKRTQEEIQQASNKGLAKSRGTEVKEWTTPQSTFHATLDQVVDKVIWNEESGLTLEDVIQSHLIISARIKEHIENVL